MAAFTESEPPLTGLPHNQTGNPEVISRIEAIIESVIDSLLKKEQSLVISLKRRTSQGNTANVPRSGSLFFRFPAKSEAGARKFSSHVISFTTAID